ncbi:MAG TPA: TylF/MycF/NovP-related O-methyltransferase [Vicinamibacterales bacterium]|nr:TylF/MycF/NovP-related O-methyltransferase [Vicinamibacterales bacterium]
MSQSLKSKLVRRLRWWVQGAEGRTVMEQLIEVHTERYRVFSAACEYVRFEQVAGDILEFGVFTGMTLALLAKCYQNNASWDVPRTVIGFDSFDGLAADTEGHGSWKAGDCATNHAWHPVLQPGARVTPEVTRELFRACELPPPRLEVGLYADTLPKVVGNGLTQAAIVHIDCDLYEAAADVLEGLVPLFQDGTMLLFDDWFHYKAHPAKGEARAFHEFLERHPEWQAVHYRSYATFCNGFILHKR